MLSSAAVVNTFAYATSTRDGFVREFGNVEIFKGTAVIHSAAATATVAAAAAVAGGGGGGGDDDDDDDG